MRVLITGARGFVGRHAIQPLRERGFDVVAATSRADAGIDPVARWITCDLLEPGAAEMLIAEVQPTHLLHLAWYTEHGKYWSGRANLLWLAASVRLIEVFAAAGGRRVVVAGTCAEYDWSVPPPYREDSTPLRPGTLYGTCKKALFESLSAGARELGLSIAWGRIFHVHGPHEDPSRFVPSLVRAMVSGRPVPMTHGLQRRDFLHAADVATALVALLDGSVAGPVNIGSGEPLRLLDVASHIARRLDAVALLRVGALPSRPEDPDALYGDVTRLRDEVGWTPRFRAMEGIDDSVSWWLAHGAGAIKA